jgi:hypothetical protein
MAPAARTASEISDADVVDLRRETVACQMEDLNALAEAMVVALNQGDADRADGIGASMDRFVLALGWSVAGVLPGILAYASTRARTPDELFAPAFILKSIAPDHPETANLLARISPDCHALLSRLHGRR